MRHLLAVCALAFGFASPFAAADQAPKVVEVQKVKDNLFVLTGGGGNSAAFVSADGVVLVDTKNPGWGPALLQKIASLTRKPVTIVINTHTHADHTSGNVALPGGVEIVAHENTKANMAKMDLFKGKNAKFLPNKTFKDRLSLLSGKDRVEVYYFGVGGTNGDAWVVIPALRTMIAGDAFAAKSPMFIDPDNGGSGVAYLETLAKVLGQVKDVDTIITGHGPVMTWSDFREYVDFQKGYLDWVRAEIKAGKTADQASEEYKVPAAYPDFTKFPPDFMKLGMQMLYRELSR